MKQNIDEWDYYKKEDIVCPYCGQIQSDSWEFTESENVMCEECEKQFFVEREIDIKFTSVPYEEEKEK